MMVRLFRAFVVAVVAGFVLAGCSGMRIVDSDVTAFSAWSTAPPLPGTTYRFERLPSQQNMQQDRLEEITRASLAKVGMVLDPQTARYSVQVMFNTQYLERFPDDGFLFGGPGPFIGGPIGGYGYGYGFGYPMRFGEPYFKRDLSILMRDLSNQKVVFETRAYHEGVWGDTRAVFPAMLDSALLGFPQPAPGTRRINVEIPR